jgi:hypothetical protein
VLVTGSVEPQATRTSERIIRIGTDLRFLENMDFLLVFVKLSL